MKHQQKLQITYSNAGKYKHIKYSHFKRTVFCIRQNIVLVFSLISFTASPVFCGTASQTQTPRPVPQNIRCTRLHFRSQMSRSQGIHPIPYPAYHPSRRQILPAILLRRSGTDQSCRLFLFSHNSAIHRFSNNSFPFYILAAFSTLLSPFHSKKVAYLQEKVAVYQKIVAVLHFIVVIA